MSLCYCPLCISANYLWVPATNGVFDTGKTHVSEPGSNDKASLSHSCEDTMIEACRREHLPEGLSYLTQKKTFKSFRGLVHGHRGWTHGGRWSSTWALPSSILNQEVEEAAGAWNGLLEPRSLLPWCGGLNESVPCYLGNLNIQVPILWHCLKRFSGYSPTKAITSGGWALRLKASLHST